MSAEGRETFLARWSRRKRERGGAEAESGEAAASPSPASLRSAPSPAQARERESGTLSRAWAGEGGEQSEPGEGGAAPSTPERAEPPSELKLPDIATLTAASDIRPFMQAGVPQALRRAALARIWSLDPAIRDFREMADYDWDFNVPGGAPGFGPLEATPEQIEQWLARIIPPAPKDDDSGTLIVEHETAAPAPFPAAAPPAGREQAADSLPLGGAGPDALVVPTPESPAQRPRRHGSAIPT